MPDVQYKQISENNDNFDIETAHQPNFSGKSQLLHGAFRLAVGFALLGSLSLNIILLYRQHNLIHAEKSFGFSPYAKLIPEISVPFSHDHFHVNENRTIENEAWNTPELDTDIGVVALSDAYVASVGLPSAQRWPWDESKGIYIVNGFHNLHCLLLIRYTIHQAYDGVTPTYPYEHVSHCINVLRLEIMCFADDTPRYTGPLHAETGREVPVSGIGQYRQCNDWGKLRKWAVDNSACYKSINASSPDFPRVERYKFCPDDRKPWN